jgi:hypothetical protein
MTGTTGRASKTMAASLRNPTRFQLLKLIWNREAFASSGLAEETNEGVSWKAAAAGLGATGFTFDSESVESARCRRGARGGGAGLGSSGMGADVLSAESSATEL